MCQDYKIDFYRQPKCLKFCLQSLQPSVFDSGSVVNDDNNDLLYRIEREIRSVRTVTHTTTSSWKYSHELGIEINYKPPAAVG